MNRKIGCPVPIRILASCSSMTCVNLDLQIVIIHVIKIHNIYGTLYSIWVMGLVSSYNSYEYMYRYMYM